MTGVRRLTVDLRTAEELARAKVGRTVAVCIPCKDEAATIGPLVQSIRTSLVDYAGLVDELVVVDDASTDDTAMMAANAGARVVSIDEVRDGKHAAGRGKGNALWASLVASSSDLIVWIDGDVTSFRPEWINRLVAPLLDDPELALVKASYRRPTDEGGGGRTTELVARPLLSLYAAELSTLDQPLAGETSGRRDVLERVPLVQGWGVEIALLLDVAREFGAAAIGQVDLGVRRHRHRPLNELSVQAAEVMATLLTRVGARPASGVLQLADGSTAALNLAERAPIAAQRQPM
jgi:glucosyl-3-phosphoglycerate synthase